MSDQPPLPPGRTAIALERAATKKMSLYRLRLVLLALLGPAYVVCLIVAAILFLVGVTCLLRTFPAAGYAAVKFAVIPLGGLLFLVLRSLFVRFPPPQGYVATVENAPALLAEIHNLRRSMTVARIGRVLLTEDFNASVIKHPRLGLLGWRQNYLLIGLPLFFALSPSQLRSVIAHELAHLSRKQGRFEAWIYGSRGAVELIHDNLVRNQHWGSWLTKVFLDWYAPCFGRHSMALRRMHEFDADKQSALATDGRTVADALIACSMLEALTFEPFWAGIFGMAAAVSETPRDVYGRMREAFAKGTSGESGEYWLEKSQKEQLLAYSFPGRTSTDPYDSHPSLFDRLSALNEVMHQPPVADVTAAEEYLGGNLGRCIEWFFDKLFEVFLPVVKISLLGSVIIILLALADLAVKRLRKRLT
jgi:Zn-dependent protease with chaperone function